MNKVLAPRTDFSNQELFRQLKIVRCNKSKKSFSQRSIPQSKMLYYRKNPPSSVRIPFATRSTRDQIEINQLQPSKRDRTLRSRRNAASPTQSIATGSKTGSPRATRVNRAVLLSSGPLITHISVRTPVSMQRQSRLHGSTCRSGPPRQLSGADHHPRRGSGAPFLSPRGDVGPSPVQCSARRGGWIGSSARGSISPRHNWPRTRRARGLRNGCFGREGGRRDVACGLWRPASV